MPSPYVDMDRSAWSALRATTAPTVSDQDLTRLRGLGEPIGIGEVEQVYLPLSQLLNLHIAAARGLQSATASFLGEAAGSGPFVIGIAGSVAVGKSTTARLLQALLARWPDHPRVDLIPTDGFLYSNDELRRRGLFSRKGFPETYDQGALLGFLAAVKSGAGEVHAPVYSHVAYDVLTGETAVVRRPDVLIVEGLNVLQPAAPQPNPGGQPNVSVSDYFDFSIYVDATPTDIERWFVERFLALRDTAFADPESFFHRFSGLSDQEATRTAASIWAEVNGPNLRENIIPTRGRAMLVLVKGADHGVRRVRLRRL